MGLFDRFSNKSKSDSDASEIEPTGAAQPETDQPQGIFNRFRQGLKRTSQLLNTDIRDLFKQEGQLVDDEMLDRLYAALVRTDMGVVPAGEIRDQIQSEFRGRVVEMVDIQSRVKEQLLRLMTQEESPLNLQTEGPTIVVVVGVNGSGKTTSIAKLTQRLTSDGKRVVVAAGDTFRAAAVEQLTVWAGRLGIPIITGEPGSDPASVAHRAVAQALSENADVCIIDTAGRLQTQTNLMDQLAKIRRVIEKQIPTAPHEVLLVLDATAGQNGISQARGFSEAIQCTGIVLSKLDGTAKGGVIIPIRQQYQIPVKFIGVGEGAQDLAPFEPQAFVDALFDSE